MRVFSSKNSHSSNDVFTLARPRPRTRLIPVPMKLGLVIMLGSGYSGPILRPMQISIGSVRILSIQVSVSMSGSINDP